MSDPARYDIPKILEQMRADYWHGLETADAGEAVARTDHIIVAIGGLRCGLPATACREVLRLPRIVRVPRLPEHLPGIVNLRGEIVAVTDLRPLLGRPVAAPTASSRLVVIAADGVRTALLVERVEGLRAVADGAVEGLTEGAVRTAVELFAGKVEEDDGALLLIDPRRLLARPELIVDRRRGAEADTD